MTIPTLLAVAHGSRNPQARVTVEALLTEVHRQRPTAGLSLSADAVDFVCLPIDG